MHVKNIAYYEGKVAATMLKSRDSNPYRKGRYRPIWFEGYDAHRSK
jgi:hypothetical protein